MWAAERARFAVEKKEMSKKNRKAQMQAASMDQHDHHHATNTVAHPLWADHKQVLLLQPN